MPDPRFTEMWTDHHAAEIDRMVRRACWIGIIFAVALFVIVKGIYG
jgi:hypothetical protein